MRVMEYLLAEVRDGRRRGIHICQHRADGGHPGCLGSRGRVGAIRLFGGGSRRIAGWADPILR